MKRRIAAARPPSSMYERIRKILDSARSNVARSVNTTQVIANWLIGREIVEEEQKGKHRAEYGEGLIRNLAIRLQADYGVGYSLANVKFFRKFYLEYPRLCSEAKGYAARSLLSDPAPMESAEKGYALRSLSWKPGLLHPTLSWTHYRTLLRVENNDARSFYEIEAIKTRVDPLHGQERRRGAIHVGSGSRKTIFASRYKLHLPSEAELRAELRREVRMLSAPAKTEKAK